MPTFEAICSGEGPCRAVKR